MASSTALPVRFEASGVITVTAAGGTAYDLLVVEPGTLRVKDGWYEPLEYKDRGAMKTPLEGDEQPSEIEFDLKFTGGAEASDLAKIMNARDTSTGLVKLFTIVIKWPNYKGASAGDSYSLASCYPVTPTEIEAGEKFDRIKARFRSATVSGTWATY